MQILVSLVHNELNFFQKECFDMAVIGPHLAWADVKIKVKKIVHSTLRFDQWNPLI